MTSNRIKPIYTKLIAVGLLLFLIALSFQTEKLLSPLEDIPKHYRTHHIKEEPDIKFPYFHYRSLDRKVNEIINDFRDTYQYINHETFFVSDELVNIFFSFDGENKSYLSVLLSTRTGREQNINAILKRNTEDLFYQKIEEIINEKYPKFIVDALNNDELTEKGHMAFRIKSNMISVYFSDFDIYPVPPHDIYVDINNHELKDILNYNFQLSEDETNIQTPPRQNLKYIALTFDDGPRQGTTDEVMKLLLQNKMSGTFFMLGTGMEKHPELVLEALEKGFEIGSHTYSHRQLARIRRANLLHTEMTRADEIFKNITGRDFTMLRPPFGQMNEHIRLNFPYAYILWSIDPRDWETRDAKHIANHILDNVEEGDIILLHDIYLTTTESLRIILPELYVRGFQAVTVSELARINNQTLEPHTIYRSFKK